MIYMTNDGANFADIHRSNTAHLGNKVKMPDLRMGCAIDAITHDLFFTAPHPTSKSRWQLFQFTIPKLQLSTDVEPIAIADIGTKGGKVLGVAVDHDTHHVYISYQELATDEINILVMEDYRVTGELLIAGKHDYGKPISAKTSEGGSIVLVGRNLFFCYTALTGEKILLRNSVDNPGEWTPLENFQGVIPVSHTLGDMASSPVDSNLFVASIAAGADMGDLYVVKASGIGEAELHKDLVAPWREDNRPYLSAIGDVHGLFAIGDSLHKTYDAIHLRDYDLEGAEAEVAEVAKISPTYRPLGPICWSGPIVEPTEAPPTAEPTPAPDTPEPTLTPPTAPPTPAPDTAEPTLAPGTTLMPTLEPIPPTPAPATPAPTLSAADCSDTTTKEGCQSATGCEFVSSLEVLEVSNTDEVTQSLGAEHISHTQPALSGWCMLEGKMCADNTEFNCNVYIGCYYDKTAGTCVASARCNTQEGISDCSKYPTQCVWDTAIHMCTAKKEVEETTDDDVVSFLLIVLAVVGGVCLLVVCFICFFMRAKKVGDQFDGKRKVYGKWFKAIDAEDAEEMRQHEQDPSANADREKKEEARKAMIARHQAKLFDAPDMIAVQAVDIYGSPPDPDSGHESEENEDEKSPVNHDDTIYGGAVGDFDEDSTEIGDSRVVRTAVELELMKKVQQARADVDRQQQHLQADRDQARRQDIAKASGEDPSSPHARRASVVTIGSASGRRDSSGDALKSTGAGARSYRSIAGIRHTSLDGEDVQNMSVGSLPTSRRSRTRKRSDVSAAYSPVVPTASEVLMPDIESQSPRSSTSPASPKDLSASLRHQSSRIVSDLLPATTHSQV